MSAWNDEATKSPSGKLLVEEFTFHASPIFLSDVELNTKKKRARAPFIGEWEDWLDRIEMLQKQRQWSC